MSRSSTTTTEKPAWEVGDLIELGQTRWVVRIITGDHVELEAMNVPAGIWWTTTLAHLPDKVAAS
nr:hypothetical protein [Microbacterium bovistercoris]